MFRIVQNRRYYFVFSGALIGLGILALRQRRWILTQWGNALTLGRLTRDWSLRKQWTKWALRFLAIAFLVVGWANPQWGTKRQKVSPKAADIILALDISQSMMAEDIAPNRMEVAKPPNISRGRLARLSGRSKK